MPPSLYKNTWFRAGIAVLVFIVIVIVVTPFGIRYAVLDWLKNNGATQATLEDVDFNPFSGRLVVKQLRIPAQGGTALSLGEAAVNLEWSGLLRKRLYLSEISLRDTQIAIERSADHITVGGIDLAQNTSDDNESPKQQASFTWGLGLDTLALDNVKIRYHDPQLNADLVINALQISKLYTWRRTLPAIVRVNARLNGGALDLQGDTTPFNEQPAAAIKVSIHDINLSFLDAIAKAQGIDNLQGLAGLDMLISAKQDSPDNVALQAKGKLSLDKFHMSGQDYSIDNDQFRWDGNTTVNIASGKLDFQTKGESAVNGLRVVDTRKSTQLAAVGAITLSGISVNGTDEISASQIQVDDARFIRPLMDGGGESNEHERPAISVQQTRIDNIQIKSLKAVDVGKIELSALTAQLIRDKQGALPQFASLQQSERTGASETTQPQPNEEPATTQDNKSKETAPLEIRLGEFEILANSKILFEDASVKPTFRMEIKPLKLRLVDLDSAQPDHAISVSLDATMNKQAIIQLSGELQPFLGRPAATMKLKVGKVELHSFSAYSRQYIGYNILSGQLNLDTNLAVKDNRINADNQLLVRNFKLEAVDNSKNDEIAAKLSMPLDTALDLLRDDHDNIKLAVPIAGDLDNPDVGISDAINQALVKATKGATMTYLKYALQPWGGILLASEFVAGQMTAVRFEPVPFAPGSDVLGEDALPYLKKVSDLLAKRPQLQLTLCGKAVVQDRQALLEASQKGREQPAEKPHITAEQLQALAKCRSMAVQNQLTSLGVNPERLFQCQPKVVEDESTRPGVDIML